MASKGIWHRSQKGIAAGARRVYADGYIGSPRLSVGFPEEDWKALQDLAGKLEVSVSMVIRLAAKNLIQDAKERDL